MIKKGEAIVMGTSAGAINMTAKWLCSKYDGYDVEESSVRDGIGLNNFSFQPHLNRNKDIVIGELLPLSKEMDVYLADQGAVRVKEDKIDIIGNVYLMFNLKTQKLNETLLLCKYYENLGYIPHAIFHYSLYLIKHLYQVLLLKSN